ncbi:AAA family ATPase, partial [Mycobacterium marinum]
NSIVPQVADVPFVMAGQGQQASIKVALAMSRSAETTAYALVEEPENHLSHTSLTKLVSRIEELAGSRQIFLTTHSS